MSLRKRQKVQSECEFCGSSESPTSVYPSNCTLDTLPPEVIEMILQFLSLQEVSATIRLVSRRCYAIAASVLNTSFIRSGTKLGALITNIKSKRKNVTPFMNRFVYETTLNALELVRVQYNMLKAVTWRYTHPEKQERSYSELCFYAGSLLDDLERLLHNATINPRYFVAQDCQSFIFTSKRFMHFFEKVSERRINRSALVSGCKVVDILDCLLAGRQMLSFNVSHSRGSKPSTITMRLKYTVRRAWFTSLKVSKTDGEDSWRDQQRFMYLRLRRLVGSVNEHLLLDSYYEEIALLQKSFSFTSTPPTALTYSGYGECGGQFFYYGHMNKYAYENKFGRVDEGDAMNDNAEVVEETRTTPYYDLKLTIQLKCSWDLAPLAVIESLKSKELEYSLRKPAQRELFLKLHANCPASAANRLPKRFTWILHTKQHKQT